MNTENYPKIGSVVNFVRQILPAGNIVKGEAIVHAICLDPEKRIMVHLSEPSSDGKEIKFNCDFNCINPSDEFVEEFKRATEAVRAIAEEGNLASKLVVDDYNGRVKKAYKGVLGDPIKLDEIKSVTIAPSTQPEPVEDLNEPQENQVGNC